MSDSPGQIGKYRIECELGRGAMGVVYQAFDPVVERHVALKTIRVSNSDSVDLLDLLRREAKSVGRFEHPNIVTLYDAGEAEGLFYMVMQLVQGESLRDRLQRQRWYRVPQVVDMFTQILGGLGYAHDRGVVHRDIKPANIMISEGGAIKLADFGIAKLIGPGTSSSGLVVGTPSYMSPEQVLTRPVDARSDIFSVGCTLYEVLTGEKAYPGDTATSVMYKIVHEAPARPAKLRPGTDPGLEEVVLRALANDPADRFPTCRDMAKALQDCLARPVGMQNVAFPPIVEPAVFLDPPSASVSDKLPSVPKTDRPVRVKAPARVKAWIIGVVVPLAVMILVVLGMFMRKPLPAVQPSQPTPKDAQRPAANAPTSAPLLVAPPPAETSVPHLVPAPVLPSPPLPRKQVAPTARVHSAARLNAVAPDDFNSMMLRGDVAFQQNAYEDALTAYLQADRLKPGNSAIRRKLKVVLTMLGRSAEAQKYR